jgi:hypothetical protein
MITIPIPGSATVDAEAALLRLELLFVERVVDLSAISDLVSQDSSLKIHILQLAHDALSNDSDELSLDERIVETGIERLRELLRQTRFRLKAN